MIENPLDIQENSNIIGLSANGDKLNDNRNISIVRFAECNETYLAIYIYDIIDRYGNINAEITLCKVNSKGCGKPT